jgi:hypothetical protein
MARESRETWSKRVERWIASGLTAKEFAAEVGVNAGTLMHWKYRLAAEARSSAKASVAPKAETVSFVEVTPTAPEAVPVSTATRSVFELVVTSGSTSLKERDRTSSNSGERGLWCSLLRAG